MEAKELLGYGIEFTQRYRAATDKYTREAACLELQLQYSL